MKRMNYGHSDNSSPLGLNASVLVGLGPRCQMDLLQVVESGGANQRHAQTIGLRGERLTFQRP